MQSMFKGGSMIKAKPILKKSEPTEADHTAVFVDIDVAYQILAVDGDAYFLKKFVEGAY